MSLEPNNERGHGLVEVELLLARAKLDLEGQLSRAIGYIDEVLGAGSDTVKAGTFCGQAGWRSRALVNANVEREDEQTLRPRVDAGRHGM